MKVIKGVFGAEPRREGEYPDCYIVGHSGVTLIVEREQNLGSYGILWFDVFKGDHLSVSMNAVHVSNITYTDEVKA